MKPKFYKVMAKKDETYRIITRTFIIYITELETYENLNSKLSELFSGWNIYEYRQIEYLDLEIIDSW